MASIIILLKQDARGEWRLHAPKGHEIAGPFRGSKFDALDWAKAWCSTWKDWTVVQEDNEQDL
jgi:hypothetical protein